MAQSGSGCGALVALGIAAVVLYQCHEDHRQAEIENRIADRAAEIEAGTYKDTYGDEGCTSDCSGHEKGFEWARDHNITSEADCSSHGDTDGSFAEGCKAYVNAEDRAAEDVQDEKRGGD
jgi:hypothetical protein